MKPNRTLTFQRANEDLTVTKPMRLTTLTRCLIAISFIHILGNLNEAVREFHTSRFLFGELGLTGLESFRGMLLMTSKKPASQILPVAEAPLSSSPASFLSLYVYAPSNSQAAAAPDLQTIKHTSTILQGVSQPQNRSLRVCMGVYSVWTSVRF